jgi:hypothetical protein
MERQCVDEAEPQPAAQAGGHPRLVTAPLPYTLVYTLRWDAVYVVRILHGAQQWP